MKKISSCFCIILSLLIVIAIPYIDASLIANAYNPAHWPGVIRILNIMFDIFLVMGIMSRKIDYIFLVFLLIAVIIITGIEYIIAVIYSLQLNFLYWEEGTKAVFAIINILLNCFYIGLLICIDEV